MDHAEEFGLMAAMCTGMNWDQSDIETMVTMLDFDSSSILCTGGGLLFQGSQRGDIMLANNYARPSLRANVVGN